MLRASNWPLEWPLVAIAAAAVLYFLGGRSRAAATTAATRGREAAFYLGLLSLVLAVDSPVDAYAATLFWVHMVQHVLLMMVAPPLLLLGRPWPRIVRPFPIRLRRPVARAVLAGEPLTPVRTAARWIASPWPAFALFSTTLLVWHLPALYDLTLRDGPVHDLEHALFFTTAVLFWAHLLPSRRPQLTDVGRVAYCTAAILVSWGLALVLALAAEPLYGGYAGLATRPEGLSALADQQLAAGVMWVPGSVPLTIALLYAVSRWLDPAAGAPRRRRVIPAEDLRPRET
ncbi:MAG TPA: cytochrome c oxidase assembly protein [Gaiellaceae bacterium]